jgi:3-hydroxyisobutyrate dehydrogenase-like beta-hydroxyacid dehydrogenase
MIGLGFIGLGQMGLPMAKNLEKSDASMLVFDTKMSSSFSSKSQAKSIADVAQQSDIIFTMLPDDDVVSDVFFSRNGLIQNSRAKTIFVDCSTVSPNLAKKISQDARKHSCSAVDAPVSGGILFAIHCHHRVS